MRDFSVLMSVYAKESPLFLEKSLQSIACNSLQPNEIVLVEDGPLTQELSSVIDAYRDVLNIVSVRLNENVGLGRALNTGLQYCSHELVARCDSDDINRTYRFSSQVRYLQDHPEIAVLSGWVEEFSINPGDQSRIRKVPAGAEILTYSRKRNPFNHPAVMFRKSSVLACGGYQHDPLYEDYALWVRIIHGGVRCDNLQEVMVDMRVGSGLYDRRGGWSYAKNEILIQSKFYKIGFLSLFQFISNLLFRVPIRLMPAILRRFFYINFLRR